jgi:hypothetical protein
MNCLCFEFPPALAGGKFNKNQNGFSQNSILFWLKPLTTIPISFLQLKLEAIQS